ncbi:MAG: TetR/AcrR family transcriptional regulator [Stappiaceae bacterium]
MVAEKTRRKILTVYMEMVATEGTTDVDLRALSEQCGVKLSTLRGSYRNRLSLIEDFTAMVDQIVLDGLDEFDAEETAKDRLFDILMARLDALAPYREAVAQISKEASGDPSLALSLNNKALTSMRWMLSAAGIEASGLKGGIKLQGLVVAYSRILRVWLDDKDAGLAKTMAALDRELNRGEGALRRLDQVERFASRVGSALERAQKWRRHSTGPSGSETASPQ